MKIPLEWLTQYVHTSKNSKELAESFTSLGLMLDKPITTYEDGKYKTDVMDLEHRMDRADWLSILGCARDLAAYERKKLILPEINEKAPIKPEPTQKIKIEVKCPDVVNRFNTRVFKNIKVKPSPDWLKNRLEAYGIPSINNIVDITNYVMVELGQPMHAQDISKLEKPEIVIRMAKKGEKITTLLGQSIELDEQTFVLTQNDTPTVIGGIVGGIATGIDESTTEIILDAGNYNQINVRKTSRRLKIINETVSRYDKFLHPALTEFAIKRATKLILDLAGGECYENEDWYPNDFPLKEQKITIKRLEQLGGNLDIHPSFLKQVLENLGYEILEESEIEWLVKIPYFRTDVEVEDDIVADVLRIFGYQNIPLQELNLAPPKDITPAILSFEDKIRDICLSLNLHEHITDPLVKAQDNEFQVKLENSQSQLKNALRTDIYEGLNEVVANYNKHKINRIGVFEIGKIYARKNKSKDLIDFSEIPITQVVFRDTKLTHAENSIEIRKLLDGLLTQIGVGRYQLKKTSGFGVDIIVDEENCGYLSWDQFTLKNEILIKFNKKVSQVITEYKEETQDDISLIIPVKVGLGEVLEIVNNSSVDVKSAKIELQNYSRDAADTKAALLTLKHNSSDFVTLRKNLSEELKNKLEVIVK